MSCRSQNYQFAVYINIDTNKIFNFNIKIFTTQQQAVESF